MKIWQRPKDGHLKHFLIFAAILALALYVAPVVTLVLLACGVADVGRHRKITYALIEEYFMAKGLVTWLLSPINLLADLLSYRYRGTIGLEELPAGHRREIEACVAGFVEHGPSIKAHMEGKMTGNKRGMLTYTWFGAVQQPELNIPAFAESFRYVKTIAVSAFNPREQTSWHFGPQRLTFRVLRNLEPVASREAYICVDDRVHYWVDQPLFIFDDTMFHRSINNVDGIRYCLFMDIIRPNRFQSGFSAAVVAMSLLAGVFKRLFYKNWSFMR